MGSMKANRKKVCVIGGSGFMASLLINKLLQKGYVVNTTVRNPGSTLLLFFSSYLLCPTSTQIRTQ